MLLQKSLLIPFAFLALITLLPSTAQASLPPLRLEIRPPESDAIRTARVFRKGDRLFVTGRANATVSAHVDVELITRDGHVVASASDDLDLVAHPRTAAARAATTTFTASFPLAEADRAERVVVFLHAGSHDPR